MQSPGYIKPDQTELMALRAQAKHLLFENNRASISNRSGQFHSTIRGRGMEFNEVRAYQAGDDIRHIDWRVTARTQKPHTKLYSEERERPVYFIVDMGPSMMFGTRHMFKSVLAAKCASLIAWAAAQHGDRVGGVVLKDQQYLELRPRGGSRGVTAFISALCTDESIFHRTNDSWQNVNRAMAKLRPGSLVILISDFRFMDSDTTYQWQNFNHHNDVLLIQIHDAIESKPPPPGVYPISDGKETMLFRQTKKQQETMIAEFRDRQGMIRQWAHQKGFFNFSLTTEEDISISLKNKLFRETRLFKFHR